MTKQELVTVIMTEFRAYAVNELKINSGIYDNGADWSQTPEFEQARDARLAARLRLGTFIDNAVQAYTEALDQVPATSSTPIFDSEEAQQGIANLREAASNQLAEFNWADLKSTDYATARRAYNHLDGITSMCMQFDDLRAQFSDAANNAGIRRCVVR